MDILKMRSMLSQGKSIYDLSLRVTYYARVSTELEQQLNSLDSQVMYYEKLIKSVPNWTFVNGYVDEGISGASVKKRDDFLRMVRDAKADCFDLILTHILFPFQIQNNNAFDADVYYLLLIDKQIRFKSLLA